MSSKLIGRRAIAALLTTGMIVGGLHAPASAYEAPADNKTADGHQVETPYTEVGYVKDEGRPGDIVELAITGMPVTEDSNYVVMKFDDGTAKVSTNFEGLSPDPSLYNEKAVMYHKPKDLTDFNVKVRIPEGTTPGAHMLRFLGHGGYTRVAWINVLDPNTKVSETKDSTVTSFSQGRGGDVRAGVVTSGLTAGATYTVTVNGEAAKIAVGRGTEDSATVDAANSLATVVLPASVTAGSKATVVLTDDKGASVSFTGEVPAYVSADSTAAGSENTFKVTTLADGATVKFLGVDDKNFLTDAQQKVAAKDGAATLEKVAIPAKTELVGKKITVTIVSGGTEHTYTTDTVVTPDNSLINVQDFTVASEKLPAGLYQSAYSAKHKALYVTRSVGRPPLKEASLIKVDPETLKVTATGEIADAPEGAGKYGPYGIVVNDKLDQVWVTNTRQNTVAVYNAADLKLIKQFPIGDAHHARDIIVDTKDQKVYVSTPRGGDVIAVFDAQKLEKIKDIKIGEQGVPGPMSLAFDQATGDLITVSLDKPVLGVVHTRANDTVETIELDPSVGTASGVAYDPTTRRALVAAQASNNAIIVDVEKKKQVKAINTGAQALSAAFDPVKRVFYVANRSGGTLTVIDADKLTVIGNLDVSALPNHVSVDDKGNAFVVNKGGDGQDKDNNLLFKISPKKPDAGSGSTDNSSLPGSSKPGKDGSSLPGSSKTGKDGSDTSSVAAGFAGVLAVLAAIVGIIGALFQHGALDKNLLPEPLRAALKL
ncbi:hypothetical protein C1Y63_09320 [Corynebacterium sp. 13CS0277]|uniref:hypothetical protein n=1 Tax=Corynebacterium sp. 13CS0277 TaxID=2071994 RepID=UPI000D031AB8|nr:hypothetical protein [Corynebacterium sp. 13CS0277]PRQ10830.1 hypothetical protein C1Y63_09320 [Corynebacterium sp. 13CS0277]